MFVHTAGVESSKLASPTIWWFSLYKSTPDRVLLTLCIGLCRLSPNFVQALSSVKVVRGGQDDFLGNKNDLDGCYA